MSPEASYEVTLITPAYNEAASIKNDLGRILAAMEGLGVSWEYILVNDGSTDRTMDLAQEIIGDRPNCRIVSYARNRGRGYALRQGFARAGGRYVITTEGDLSWGPEIIGRLYKALKATGHDLVIASVFLDGGGLRNVPRGRRMISSWGNVVMRWAFGGGLTMLSGMTRGYRREVLEALYLESADKEIHLEIVSKAQDLGFSISEIPGTISWSQEQVKGGKGRARSMFRHVIPHLVNSFSRAPAKSLFYGCLGFSLVGAATVVFSALNKIYRITPIPMPHLLTYGLILIGAGVIFALGVGLSVQIAGLSKSLVHTQSQLKMLEKVLREKRDPEDGGE